MRCGQCGSAMVATQFDRVTCLECASVTKLTPPQDRGRVDNPDGPAEYYGDNGVTYG